MWKVHITLSVVAEAQTAWAIMGVLTTLIEEELPGSSVNSRSAKDKMEGYLVDIVDATTRFSGSNSAIYNHMDTVSNRGDSWLSEMSRSASELDSMPIEEKEEK